MKRTRRLAIRRDRRKAKQSKWRRAGKNNPRKVGHGGSGEAAKGFTHTGRKQIRKPLKSNVIYR